MSAGIAEHPRSWCSGRFGRVRRSGPGRRTASLRPRRTPRALAGLALLAAGAGALAWGAWIPAKAALGQLLLERAWERTVAGERHARPWPWADTRPIARLSAPRLGERVLVLEGASGATLAWGPGHLPGTPAPGSGPGPRGELEVGGRAVAGNAVIAGHRDTHFAFLEALLPGDLLEVETAEAGPEGGDGGDGRDGGQRWGRGAIVRTRYRVTEIHVVDEHDTGWLAATPEPALTLVTCYPFGAVAPGGPLRYVVRAEEVPVRVVRVETSAIWSSRVGSSRAEPPGAAHLVPNMRSPASPRPGTM